jgi:LuxR family maltose regulon positive regulatory protein
MEHAGLFLFPLGEDHHWYRFHPLFRALLLQRLEDAIGESGINALHLKASRWFEESGNIDEAMTHALAAGDATRAASILARQLQKTLVLGRWQDLERWLKVLPAEVIDSDVDILLARCWMNQSRGRYDVVRMLINRTSAILAVREENDAVAWTAMYRAELAVLGAFVGDTGPGSASALECAAIAYQALDGSGRFAEMFAIHVYGSKLGLSDRQQANCFLKQIVATNAIERDTVSSRRILWARATQIMLARHDGEPQRVAYLAETLLRSAKRDHAPRLAAMGHFWVGLTNFEMNRVQEAEGHFRSALAEPASGMIVALNAATLLALSLNAQGFRDEADVVIDTMMDQLLDHEVTGSVAYLRVVMAHLALARGDLGTAAFEVRALPAELDIKSFGWIDLPAVTIATVWVMERTPDRLEAAATLLAEMQEQAEALILHQPQVQIALVQGLLHRVSGQDREAGECLDKALAMAAGAGYIRTFMDLGPAIRPLLEWHAQHNCKSLYLERLLEHFGTLRPPRTISPLRDRDVLRHHLMATFPVGEFESLTERELDVLLGLQRRLSNKEIADELSISPLTIKTHTRNIYGKLGVNSRRQAIARAMDLGLLA